MKNLIISVGVLMLVAAAMVLGVLWLIPQISYGSVPVANEYQSTTTPGVSDSTALCSGPGVLGQITVGVPNTGYIALFDATTSDITKRDPTFLPIATTSLEIAWVQKVGTSTTLTYDALARNGLLVHFAANAPTTTITYRCY